MTTRWICVPQVLLDISLGILAGLVCLNGYSFGQEKTPTPPPNPPTTDDKEHTELINRTQEIISLLGKMESTDVAERKAAFQSLNEIGLPVVPFIIDKLKEKGIYVELASRILSFHLPTPEESQAHLKEWQERIGTVSDKEVAVIERYFYSKYLSAVQRYQKEDYQEALEIVNAILKLETRLSFANNLRSFRVSCEEKIIQKNILRMTLRTPKEVYEIGDKIFVTVKMENVALTPVEINLPGNPFMIIYLTATEYGPFGEYNSLSRMVEEKLAEKSITLKPQESWEHTFCLNTAEDGTKTIYYRTYDVTTEIRPGGIKTGKEESIRKITSLPLLIRTFPPKIETILKDPIASLKHALEGGAPLEIFLCALLVPEADKEKELALLMPALDKSSEDAKKAILTALRHITRLPVEMDEKTWRQWWQERQKK